MRVAVSVAVSDVTGSVTRCDMHIRPKCDWSYHRFMMITGSGVAAYDTPQPDLVHTVHRPVLPGESLPRVLPC